MFLRGALVASIGPFDPNLGLGTPAGGGEDTDFAIRAYLRARQSGIVDLALVGHATPDRLSAAKYFHGALVVLSSHALERPALAFEFLRKLLVGVYFIADGKLAPRGYFAALRDGARALVAARREARGA
jgi:hypothetical protein